MVVVVLIGAVLTIIGITILGTYNKLVAEKKKVEQAYSTIDVYLMQRFDLIPNLVECVKGYAKHESEMFEKIAALRTSYMGTKKIEEAEKLETACNKLIAYAENYPELKASDQFLSLQQKLSKMESQLQAARRLYNGEVTRYNTSISVIPTNIIAKLFGFKESKLFEIEDISAKENINLDL